MYEDEKGNVNPNGSITRAEFAAIINRKHNYTAKWSGQFADVDEFAWYANDMKIAKQIGYINGDENGNAHPKDKITRAEAISMLMRVVNEQSYIERFVYPDIFILKGYEDENILNADDLDYAVTEKGGLRLYFTDSGKKKLLAHMSKVPKNYPAGFQLYSLEAPFPCGYYSDKFHQTNDETVFFPISDEIAIKTVRCLDIIKKWDKNFTDFKDIPSWAIKYVLCALYTSEIQGYADSTFRPNALLTRAEAFMMLTK